MISRLRPVLGDVRSSRILAALSLAGAALAASALAGSCMLPALEADLPGAGAGGATSAASAGQGGASASVGGVTATSSGGEGGTINVGPWAPAVWAADFATKGTSPTGELDIASLGTNIYVGGSFSGEFMPPATGNLYSGADVDAFIAGYDGSFNPPTPLFQPVVTGTPGSERRMAIAAMSKQLAFLGTFTNTMIAPAGSLMNTMGTGPYDVYVAKANDVGSLQWMVQLENTLPSYPVFTADAVALSEDGSIFTVGLVAGTVTVTGKNSMASSLDFGNPDVFLAKTNPDAMSTVLKTFGDINAGEAVSAVAVDALNVYIAGRFTGEMKIGSATVTSMEKDQRDTFVVALDAPNLDFQWSVVIPGSTGDERVSLTARAGGGVVLTGSFFDTLYTPLGERVSAGEHDVYAIAIDPNGQTLWATSFGGEQDERALDVAEGPKPDTSLFITGSVSAPNLTRHLLMAELTSDGKPRCLGAFGSGDGDQEGRGITVDSTGAPWVIGSLNGTIELVPGEELTGPGNTFMAKFPADVCP